MKIRYLAAALLCAVATPAFAADTAEKMCCCCCEKAACDKPCCCDKKGDHTDHQDMTPKK
jgi:hypothetical protein